MSGKNSSTISVICSSLSLLGSLPQMPFFSFYYLVNSYSSLVAQLVKHLPTMQETQVPSLGWEDPLEKEMATHSIILAWRIPWTEETGRLQSMGS